MTRTVIRVEELLDLEGRTLVTFHLVEPPPQAAHRARILACDPRSAPFSDLAAVVPGEPLPLQNDLVRVVGERMYEELKQHPGIAQALDGAANTSNGKAHPIWVLTSASDAESLPWEVLYHPNAQFFGLDPRWPIARVVHAEPASTSRFFAPPLRIAAVVAAADRDPIGEWEALRRAVEASGLDVELELFLAHDALHAHVKAQALPWVGINYVPGSSEELTAALLAFRPHVLHVFCHGSSQYQGMLEVATRAQAELGDPPLYLTASHLSRLRDLVWLITLDACEGAMATRELHSLAYALVKDGVPSVIGMREAIDHRDANTFCEAFYRKALVALAAQVGPGARFKVDWMSHLHAARSALCKRIPGPEHATAAKSKPWTLPVLYRRREELDVWVARDAPDTSVAEQEHLFSQLDALRRFRETLHPGTPAAHTTKIDQEIAALAARLG